MPASATTSSGNAQATPILPFTIGSRVSSRLSFQLTATLGTSVVVPQGAPVLLPAVGYVKSYRMEFTATIVGGTPTLSADAPWNIIDHVTLKNSGGQTIINSLTGYDLYQANKWNGVGQGLATPHGIQNDPKLTTTYVASTSQFHFYLDVPVELDPSQALGVLPALASNRSYQLEIALAPIATVFGGTLPTSVTVAIDTTANYWDIPSDASSTPFGLGTLAQWTKESPIIAQGEQYTRSNNVGNVLRLIVLTLRNSAGVRDDADWTSIFEMLVDNNPQIRLKKGEWRDAMSNWSGYAGTTLDAPGAQDAGVFVIPFHLLAGGYLGDQASARAQLLATLDATLLQLHGLGWGSGANAGTLSIVTQSISSDNSAFIYSK